jgi:hypothetical protein
MNSHSPNETQIVAALLTVAKAMSQQGASAEDVLSDYQAFLSKLTPQPKPVPMVPKLPTGRKFRDE